MFYVKAKLNNDGAEIKVPILDNVYTVCPVCVKEQAVDLADILKTGDADLFSSQVICDQCAKSD